jgi:hypothetical protein
MPHTTISAGMTVKRPGQERYSSDGYHLTVEMEAEIGTAEHFRAITAALFSEVRGALESEISNGKPVAAKPSHGDLWGGSGGNGNNGHKPASESAETFRGAERISCAPVSTKQARYLFSLARDVGMRKEVDVTDWINKNLGLDKNVYGLNRVEASRAIDLLNKVIAGNGSCGRPETKHASGA